MGRSGGVESATSLDAGDRGRRWPVSQRRVFLNALGDESAEIVRAAFGVNYERLVEMKRRYDPANFFRVNLNITPAQAASI